MIGNCLAGLPEDWQVVVVCNGCTDDTAEVAQAARPAMTVVEIPQPSKVAAMDHGDQVASSFPRLYLDADVVLEPGAVEGLQEGLTDGVHVVSPTARHVVSGSNAGVRSYYRIWTVLPSVNDIVGRGAYMLSEEGRGRFATFPDLINDDCFVRDLFTPQERAVVGDAVSVVQAPTTLRGLVRRKVRVFMGNRLVYAAHEDGRTLGRRRQVEWLGVVRGNPRLVADLPVYLAVTVTAKMAARWRLQRGATQWSRDDSSRVRTS